MQRKEYLVDREVTKLGRDLVEQVGKEQVVAVKQTATTFTSILATLKEELYKRKEVRQIKGFGNVYFIPGEKDLEDFLLRFKRKYPELWDLERIEKALVKHLVDCCKKDKFSPAIKYFIIKEGTGSQLASVLENWEDAEEDKADKQFKIIDTKGMFG